jgi:hypothetical protein
VPPTGFSQNTCLPAAQAASISSTWSMLGAAIITMSTSASSMTRRQSCVPFSNPNERIASSVRAGTASAQTTSRESNSRSSNNVGMRSIDRL